MYDSNKFCPEPLFTLWFQGPFGWRSEKVRGQKMVREWKSRGMEKMCLYKFTHIPLLKNDAQLKQKSKKKKKAITQIY